jgi:hypothetical protein
MKIDRECLTKGMLYPIPFLNLGGKTKCDCPDLDFSREEGS